MIIALMILMMISSLMISPFLIVWGIEECSITMIVSGMYFFIASPICLYSLIPMI